MTIKRFSVGIGMPMIIVGFFIAIFLASIQPILKDTLEFIGSLIGILGVLIFIAGLFVRKTPNIIP
jgi:flagellar biosynthesis protein FliQ